MTTRVLSSAEGEKLLNILQERFEAHPRRHPGLAWVDVAARLNENTEKLWSLHEMERTGGEPDVVGFDETTKEYIFFDCSPDSPPERRSICYDQQALESRKKHPPKHSALGLASEMGIEILTEDQYRYLQSLGDFDLKSSSWIKTPARIREQGGALFCDKRYDTVFVYHNGADSYYRSRGFRGMLKI